MADIGTTIQGLASEFETPRLSTGAAFSTALARAAMDSRVAWRHGQSENRARYRRLGGVVLEALDAKITALETAAARFDWPASGSAARGARLTLPANEDAALAGRLRAALPDAASAVSFYKFFSRGRAGSAVPGIDAGDYTFSVSLGGASEQATVRVAQGATWGQIVADVAAAINGTSLAAQAEVIDQTGAYQNLDFLPKTGKVLGVSVSAGHAAQDLALTDVSGHLLAALDLEATSVPVGPTPTRRYNVATLSRAQAASFVSNQLNPEALAGLSAGVHKLRLRVGDVTAAVSVTVTASMTMEELLVATATAINSSSGELTATVRDGTMSSGLTGRLMPAVQRSRYLEITLASPKLGDRLSLEEYGGPWLEAVDGFHDPGSGLPNWVTGGERYVATATANGWTAGNIYEYDGSAWTETKAVATNAVHSIADDADFFFDSASWSAAASGKLLDILGLTATAAPGADATARVNGTGMTSETGIFTLDEGRVLLRVDGSAGEGAGIPLSVVEGMNEVQTRLEDMLGAYNDLRSFVLKNADLLEAGFADAWRAPVADLGSGLSWLGIGELPDSGALWTDNDAFWKAVGQDQDAARALLFDAPDGLAPAWTAVAAAVRTPSLADRLIQSTLVADLGPAAWRETANRERGLLQQVIDAASTTKAPAKDPYLETSGLLRSKA